MLSLGPYLRAVQEPSTQPDFSGMDSPQDLIAEVCQKHGIGIAAFLAALDNMQADGLLSHLPGFRSSADSLPRIIALIGDGPNCGLRAWCLDFVAGTNIFAITTETDIGDRWGVERATVNRLIGDIRKSLSITSVPGCRPQSTRITYSIRATKNHAEGKIHKKPKPIPADYKPRWKLKTNSLSLILSRSSSQQMLSVRAG